MKANLMKANLLRYDNENRIIEGAVSAMQQIAPAVANCLNGTNQTAHNVGQSAAQCLDAVSRATQSTGQAVSGAIQESSGAIRGISNGVVSAITWLKASAVVFSMIKILFDGVGLVWSQRRADQVTKEVVERVDRFANRVADGTGNYVKEFSWQGLKIGERRLKDAIDTAQGIGGEGIDVVRQSTQGVVKAANEAVAVMRTGVEGMVAIAQGTFTLFLNIAAVGIIGTFSAGTCAYIGCNHPDRSIQYPFLIVTIGIICVSLKVWKQYAAQLENNGLPGEQRAGEFEIPAPIRIMDNTHEIVLWSSAELIWLKQQSPSVFNLIIVRGGKNEYRFSKEELDAIYIVNQQVSIFISEKIKMINRNNT